MHKLKLKEFLEREMPPVNYDALRAKVMERAFECKSKRERFETREAPKSIVSLLFVLMVVNVGSLATELVSHYFLFSSGHFNAFRFFLAVSDNAVAIFLNLYVGMLLDKGFFGVYRTYRLVRNQFIGMKNFMVKIPALLALRRKF